MLILLMEVLDINNFLSFKMDSNTQDLDNSTLEVLYSLFGNVDKNKKNKKNIKKPNTNILKNQKVQNKKDIMSNKVNLILNKLSESNIDSLIIEFIQNINQIDIENFEEIQKTFYLKVISEISFIKIYLQFLKIIGFLYNKVQGYDLSYFYSMVEAKFRLDYSDYDIEASSKLDFINEHDGETKRINNLILIKNLVENKMLNSNIYDFCDKIILNQNIFLPDIYHWYSSKNRELKNEEFEKIKLLLKKDGINSREHVLLENLINRKNKPLSTEQNQVQATNTNQANTISVVQVVANKMLSTTKNTNITTSKITNEKQKVHVNESEKIKTDTLQLECENIIEEFLIIKSIDDIKYFIENRCVDAVSKNKFCEYLIDKYFLSNKESSSDIIELMKQLTKTHTLFKSNLSRGLLLVYSNWKEKSIDYVKPVDKMKNILITLKNIGITKGIEFLLDQYKIQVNQV
jgi:hypothetical protein